MWTLKDGIYRFDAGLPVTIGYAPSSKNQEKIIRNTIFLRQTHSHRIVNIDEETSRVGDGLYTRKKNLQLGIRVADCLPIYFFNLKIGIVGILHAGWRGTLDGISGRLNQILDDYQYVFGPAIGPDCYEISADLADEFNQRFDRVTIIRGNRYFLDLKKANRQFLKGDEAGDLDICNHCEETFSSYRRDGKGAGRDIAF
ncbi:MAG TPA: laccase domain-containing protein, partial [bacterium (Candidatus Stahlbacteria)]|nr:laccase domain-containing protein [Candidatus Stahlbacteria bacterium]